MDGVTGFIASVKKPSNLNVTGLGERVSIDLFVNGRLRERNLLDKVPSAQVPSEYVYGQIYFDGLDEDEEDPFISSREGVRSDIGAYNDFLEKLEAALRQVYNDWDAFRHDIHEQGDPENPSMSPRRRATEDMINETVKEFKSKLSESDAREGITFGTPQTDAAVVSATDKSGLWIDALREDAGFNSSSYVDCFMLENLLRRYVEEKKKTNLGSKCSRAAKKYREAESENKKDADINIEIRKNPNDLSYLSMDSLIKLVDSDDKNLSTYGRKYKPLRDATMHTSLLTDDAKEHLNRVSEDIETRVMSKLRE
jgi:hypothetical protein